MRPMGRIGFLFLLLAAGSAAAQAAALKDVRVWGSPDSTRVVLDLTEPATYTLFTLSGPERIVIDFDAIDADLGALGSPAASGVVKGVRFGERGRSGLRVVIDVNEKVEAKGFLTPPNETYGHRLVVDLGHAQPAMAQAPAPVKVAGGDGQRDLVIAIDRRPRRRGPGRDRQGGHAREDGRARDREEARGPHQRRAGHERRADAHRRLLREVQGPHRPRAHQPGGPVRVGPCRRVHGPQRARLLGLRALDAPREQRGREDARRPRERGGPHRRRVAARQERRARHGAARPVAERRDQREPRRRVARARGARHGRPGSRRATCSMRASSC